MQWWQNTDKNECRQDVHCDELYNLRESIVITFDISCKAVAAWKLIKYVQTSETLQHSF